MSELEQLRARLAEVTAERDAFALRLARLQMDAAMGADAMIRGEVHPIGEAFSMCACEGVLFRHASDGGEVFRSYDGGKTWARAAAPARMVTHSMVPLAREPTTVLLDKETTEMIGTIFKGKRSEDLRVVFVTCSNGQGIGIEERKP